MNKIRIFKIKKGERLLVVMPELEDTQSIQKLVKQIEKAQKGWVLMPDNIEYRSLP